MSLLQGIQQYHRLLGWKGVLLVAKARLRRVPIPVKVTVPGFRHPIYLRLRTSDVSLFSEIIVNAEYALKLSKSPRVIIDAGSNIGLAAVFFANRYPEAKIIAIEPEPSNYEVLRRNAAPYPNVVPVCAAIWKDNESVCIVDPGTGKWGFQISAADGRNPKDGAGCVTGLALGELMKRHRIERVDLLKLDIEGAEKEVFENCQSWIDRVDMIVVELHDRFRAGCSRSFYNATSDFRYEWHKGETTVVARNEKVVGCVAGDAGTVSRPFRLETVSGSVL